MQLQENYSRFEALDAVVVAISQEDTTLEKAAAFTAKGFGDGPAFEVVADLERQVSTNYDRTTAYLIDKQGIVRQEFPMLIHSRPSWGAILGELEALEAEQAATTR